MMTKAKCQVLSGGSKQWACIFGGLGQTEGVTLELALRLPLGSMKPKNTCASCSGLGCIAGRPPLHSHELEAGQGLKTRLSFPDLWLAEGGASVFLEQQVLFMQEKPFGEKINLGYMLCVLGINIKDWKVWCCFLSNSGIVPKADTWRSGFLGKNPPFYMEILKADCFKNASYLLKASEDEHDLK
ncbi:hypothetical protein E2320_013635 [Naja naja]|nr:hypothetical protein E2320_013635 [Naja naja]